LIRQLHGIDRPYAPGIARLDRNAFLRLVR